jgi:succinate-semialdehyde dehydrogenase/glutarate-semialdehyde dehydrogenase
MNDDTNIGPIATPEGPEWLKECCDDAISMGGSVLLGGNMNTDENGLGRFFEPTIIANANNGMKAV